MSYAVSYFYLFALLSMVVLITLGAVSFPRTPYHKLTLLNFFLVGLWILDDFLSNIAVETAHIELIAYVLAPSWALLPYALLVTVLTYTRYPKKFFNDKVIMGLSVAPILVLILVYSGQLYTEFHPASENGHFFYSVVSPWQIFINIYIGVYLLASALVALASARQTSNDKVLQTAKVLGYALGPAGFMAVLSNAVLTPLGVMLPFIGAEMVAIATWALGLGMLRHNYFVPIDVVMAQRDQAQDALRFRERILAVMPIGAAFFVPETKTKKGTLLYANQQFLQLAQMASTRDPLPQIVNQSITSLALEPAASIANEELKIVDAQGKAQPVLLSIAQIDSGSNPILLLGLQDLRSINAAQDEFREHQFKLMEAQKMEAIGRLSAGMAHDFNNQLLSMIGSVSSVGFDPELPYSRELEEILRSVDRARALVNRLHADKLIDVLQQNQISVNALLQQLRPVLQKILGPNRRLDLRLPRAEVWIRINPLHLEQVLMTLTENARDAMSSGGTLHVDYEADAQKLSLIVRDEGQGMSPKIMKRIFEPLFSTKGEKGTGFGLSMVKRLLDEAGAEIEVSSILQQGSIFRLIFAREPSPDKVVEDVYSDLHVDKHLHRREKDYKLQGLRVLLVDDNAAVLRAVAQMLRGQGAEIRMAASAQEILSQSWVGALPFDLLLSDIDMPQVSGVELAYALRGIEPGLPVILMSGYQERPQEIEDLKIRFIAKPFLPDELFAEIEQLRANLSDKAVLPLHESGEQS